MPTPNFDTVSKNKNLGIDLVKYGTLKDNHVEKYCKSYE